MQKFAFLLIALAFVWTNAAEAARVTPMTIELAPTGRNSSARLEVTNSEDRELPIEIQMYRGIIGERGELDLQPADERFLVFPPQTVIGAGGQQIFRIQYLPDEPMSQSEVFYASVRQIPVALAPEVSRIQVVMRFNVLVNVVPEGTSPEPVVTWARPATIEPPEEGEQGDTPTPVAEAVETPEPIQGLEVRIENQGSRFFAAGRTGWTISGTTANGETVVDERSASQVGSDIGMGVVPPGGARIFFVPVETPLLADTVTVTLDE